MPMHATITKEKPKVVIIDSIQTIASEALESSAGSVGQVRECAAAFLKYAKETGKLVVILLHVKSLINNSSRCFK